MHSEAVLGFHPTFMNCHRNGGITGVMMTMVMMMMLAMMMMMMIMQITLCIVAVQVLTGPPEIVVSSCLAIYLAIVAGKCILGNICQ